MFDVDFLFSKQSPLYKVWLAANFHKTLSNAQIVDLDIDVAVKELLSPQIQLAVRMYGHMLLGIVRIYYQKTCLVLAESELAETQNYRQKALKESVYAESKIYQKSRKRKTHVNLKNSRVESITLKDESLPILRIAEDSHDTEKIPKFEEEVMRSFMGGLEESTYELSRLSQSRKLKELSQLSPQPVHEVTFELPDIELPPDRPIDETPPPVKIRKRNIHLYDNVTLIDKETMRLYLADTQPITKIFQFPTVKTNIFDDTFAFGTASELLINLRNKSISLVNNEFDQLSVIEPVSNFEICDYPHLENIDDAPQSILQSATFNELSLVMVKSHSTSFNSFTSRDSRENACRKFVDLLHFHKQNLISLFQKSQYDDIIISDLNKESTFIK